MSRLSSFRASSPGRGLEASLWSGPNDEWESLDTVTIASPTPKKRRAGRRVTARANLTASASVNMAEDGRGSSFPSSSAENSWATLRRAHEQGVLKAAGQGLTISSTPDERQPPTGRRIREHVRTINTTGRRVGATGRRQVNRLARVNAAVTEDERDSLSGTDSAPWWECTAGEGEGEHILRYDEMAMIRCSALITWKGTTFHSTFIWLQLCAYYLLALAIGEWVIRLEADGNSSSWHFHQADMAAMTSSISTLVAFLMGMCVSSALGRWWLMRDACFGGLWGAINDLCLVVGTTFAEDGSEENEAEQEAYETVQEEEDNSNDNGIKWQKVENSACCAQEFKARLMRLSLASVALLFMQARGELPDNETLPDAHLRGIETLSALSRKRNCCFPKTASREGNGMYVVLRILSVWV